MMRAILFALAFVLIVFMLEIGDSTIMLSDEMPGSAPCRL